LTARLIGTVLAIIVVVVGVLVIVSVVTAAPNPGAVYVTGAAKEMRQAKASYREAVRVLEATKKYSRYDYTPFAGRYVEPVKVGRWVALARRCGWPWPCIERLMCIIARESSGYPGVVNDVIGCTGLLQIWPGNVSQPSRLTNPRYNLAQGLRLYREAGWSPWSIQ
jgi:hypothetical protein